MSLSDKQEQNLGCREQTGCCQWEGAEGGVEWEFGVSRCKLVPGEWVKTPAPLYNTDNYNQYPMINYSSVGKESAYKAGDQGSIPGLGRSPGEGNGNPLWYSCLENPMDTGAWRATVHGVTRVRHDLATETTNQQP